jgi:hypothetical protein
MLWGRIGWRGEPGLFFQAPGCDWVAIDEVGFRCETCGMVVLCKSTVNDTEAPCLTCGAEMAPGVTVCPQCGWTYEAPAHSPET